MEDSKKQFIKNFVKENQGSSAQEMLKTLQSMFKNIIQEALNSELDQHLGYSKYDYKNKDGDNSRNGFYSKTVNSSVGELDLDMPRDRNAEFNPHIVKKGQNDISGIEDKILFMVSKGLSLRDIQSQIKDIYGIDVSHDTISKITDKILPIIKEWQSRPLKSNYTFVFMDAIHCNVKHEGQVIKKAAYVVLAVDMYGLKEVLGIYIGANETSKFWLSVMTDLKNRGVKDILIVSVDGLNGFKEAITQVFPSADIQRCIVHQIRNSTKFVSYKDLKPLVSDMKEIYTAANEEIAFEALAKAQSKWKDKYSMAFKSWEDNWSSLSTFFRFTPEIRRIMYTTNIIESLNRQYRKVLKTKSSMPNDEALMKLLYLVTQNVEKKWTKPFKDWGQIIGQLSIIYGNRVSI